MTLKKLPIDDPQNDPLMTPKTIHKWLSNDSQMTLKLSPNNPNMTAQWPTDCSPNDLHMTLKWLPPKWPSIGSQLTPKKPLNKSAANHVSSAVSAAKSDLTGFCPPLISINFFFVENLWGFCRPWVSLLTPIILLHDRRIWPWIIYDLKTSAVYASTNYRWIFFTALGAETAE